MRGWRWVIGVEQGFTGDGGSGGAVEEEMQVWVRSNRVGLGPPRRGAPTSSTRAPNAETLVLRHGDKIGKSRRRLAAREVAQRDEKEGRDL